MAKKNRKFKTEVQQLLDLVIHSLYSKKEIFLRELISNASDAIDRARLESLTDKDLLEEDDPAWEVRIEADKEQRTLTISDNGIGMSADEVEKNIGTIASSGTRRFLESLKQAKDSPDTELIGQFGVGFYASFMVADKVTLVTRRAGKDQQALRWISTGEGDYTIEDVEREQRGTSVTLHLREGMDEHLEEWNIRNTVQQYSDYIAYPIVMEIERTKKGEDEKEEVTREDETLNTQKAIWQKQKKDVTKEEYTEFYKHISHDYSPPLEIVHFAAEGATEFRALLYIPSQAPFDLHMHQAFKGLHLYVRNVFINDDCKELIPEYMRFIRGVVDSSDLPLNVSREMLQDDAIIRRIRKSVVTKVLDALSKLKKKKMDEYLKFYSQFGRVLKEGLHLDAENSEKLKELVMFPSSKSEPDRPVALAEYVERMPQDQKQVYYLTAESREAAEHSPHLEVFKSRDIEVLFFLDPIDEWITPQLTEYKGKQLKPIDQGEVDLGTETEEKETKEKREQATKTYDDLLKHIQQKLEEEIKEVRVSSRLTDSPCCLVSDDEAMNATMERMMRAMNQEVPKSKRILELNPDHPLMARMKTIFDGDQENPQLGGYIELVYGQALILEGSPLKDPQRFSQLVSELMVGVN